MIDKQQSGSAVHANGGIADWPLPAQVQLPLVQHQGNPAPVIVTEGQLVRVGQPLTHSNNLFEVPVHASIAGRVDAILADRIILTGERSPEPQPDAVEGTEPRTNTRTGTGADRQFNHWSRDRFITEIHRAGLVGLGGACYPVAAKIDKLGAEPADILLINAAECDPAICCDEALLKSQIAEIATGICLAQLSTNAKKTIIGIESDKANSGKALLTAVKKSDLSPPSCQTELSIVTAAYPNGAESLLMSLCTGVSLTAADIQNSKRLTFNLGTCYALYQALIERRPSTHRITTYIDSNGTTGNIRVPLGTPINNLATSGDAPAHTDVYVGGHMMGVQVTHDAVVTKGTNCIQFKTKVSQPVVKPCVRCGLCVDACPVNLMPQYLLAQSTNANYANLQTLRVQHCIECACCDRVCPSHIPLAQVFANAKLELIKDTEAKRQAELAKARYDKRQKRLESSQQREFKKLSKKQSNLNRPAMDGQQAKRQLVEAALQRARNKKGKPS